MKFCFRILFVSILLMCLNCSGSNVLTDDDLPQIFIISPLDKSTHIEGEEIIFSAAILEGKNRGFVGSTITWSSNIDGEIGRGEKIRTSKLSENNHIIIVKVASYYGGESEDTISLYVRFNNPPQVFIESPIDNLSYNYSKSIIFKGHATDIEDNLITDSSLVWISNVDSVIGYGDSCSLNTLTNGPHTISLRATDLDGYSTITSINIIVLVTFEKTFGTIGNDYAYAVKQTKDKGFVISGKTALNGAESFDAYMLKIKSYGELTWENTYGGNLRDNAVSVDVSLDGGYVAFGSTRSFGHGGNDMYLFKTTSHGDLIWYQAFGGYDDDYGYAFIETKKDGFVTVGTTINIDNGSTDVLVVKTNSNGAINWERTFRKPSKDICTSICETTDGGYLLTGWTTSFNDGSIDVYVLKIDSNGSLIWETSFGGSKKDVGTSVLTTIDGGFIIVGWTSTYGAGGSDLYLLKIDAQGLLVWEKTYGGNGDDIGTSISNTYDNGFIITGYTTSYGLGRSDLYLLKVDANGNFLWEKTFGGSENDIGESVSETFDRGFIVAGHSNSFGNGMTDVYLIKTDSLGNVY